MTAQEGRQGATGANGVVDTTSVTEGQDNAALEAELRLYLDVNYRDTAGKAHLAIGRGGHQSDRGTYEFDEFSPRTFDWPAQADQLVRTILQHARPATDVFICPHLMNSASRSKGGAAARWTVHADVDGGFDEQRVVQLGGFAVASGGPGHAHVYVPLSRSVSASEHRALCSGLRDCLGAKDSKISDNDLLRPPGSVNHKGPAFGLQGGSVARLLMEPSGDRRDPAELARQLGISMPSPVPAPIESPDTTPQVPVRIEDLPLEVQDAVDEHTSDRSADTMRVVGACYNAGLTLAAARTVVALRDDLRERLDQRDDDDVQSCWLKVIDSRQGPAAAADEAMDNAEGSAHPPRIRPRGEGTDIGSRSDAAALPCLDIAALLAADRPPREWTIRQLIPSGTSVAVVAAAGIGKSFLALAMALAIARGNDDFAGLPIPERRRVLLLDMENTEDDLADRLTALGVRPFNVDELDLILVHLPAIAGLDTPEGARQLERTIDTYGLQPGDVVVLDSLQRLIDGPENDADTMRQFYRCTGLMLKRRGLTVLRTDNTGKDPDKGARGSSGKRDDVDLELILTRDTKDEALMLLKPGKARQLGIGALRFRRDVDPDTGRVQYLAGEDPFHDEVQAAVAAMGELGLDRQAGESRATTTLKSAGHQFPRAAIRAALKLRKPNPSS